MTLNKNHIKFGALLFVVALATGLYLWHTNRESVQNAGELQTDEGVNDMEMSQAEGVTDPLNSSGMSAMPAGSTSDNIQGSGGMGAGTDLAPVSGNSMQQMDTQANQELKQASCFPREQLMPSELLPQDNDSLWAQVNPQGQGSLKDKNFLQASWATGVNTVGSSLRNGNLQIRSEPPNPQVAVSPWMNSTIEPDTGRLPLEIGGCS